MRAPADAVLTPAQAVAASRGWKALMPIGRHRFLDYILSALADADCHEVGVVIGPDQRADFEAFLESEPPRRTHVRLIEQHEPLGSAHAVWSAAKWIQDTPFLTMNGDNLYPADALEGLARLSRPGLAVFDRDRLVETSNIPAERVAAFAMVELTHDGALARIVEKPGALPAGGRPVLISMNIWRFESAILDACRDVPRSPRGEYELPGAVQLAIERGMRFDAIAADGPVLDLSSRVDVAAIVARLADIEPRP